MKNRILLFGALCLFGCGSIMDAMQDSNDDRCLQMNDSAAIQPDARHAIEKQKFLTEFRAMAMAFALVNHPRCGETSAFYGLPIYSVQQICDGLKMECLFPGCTYVTVNKDDYIKHGNTHTPEKRPNSEAFERPAKRRRLNDRLQCEKCDQSFSSFHALVLHAKESHSSARQWTVKYLG